MSGGIEETSASFEARSAPRSYPTATNSWEGTRRGSQDRSAMSAWTWNSCAYAEDLCLRRRDEKGAPSGPGAKAGRPKVSETIRLKASDGFELSAYVAKPSGTPKG